MKEQPKQGRRERATEIGITMQTLSNWERSGVDVFDDDQVREKVSRCRHLPHGLKPEFFPKKIEMPTVDSDDPTQVDIEAIIRQIGTANDKHSAQTVKTQIDALVNAYKLREAAGKYVSKTMVEESLIRIGAAVKAALLRMEADLPPMLEGASPAQSQKIIRQKVDEVMTMLADESSSVWESDEQTES